MNKRFIPSILKSQSGTSFIEVLITSVVAMMFMLGAGTALSQRNAAMQSQKFIEALQNLSELYEEQISDSRVWEETKSRDVQFSCLDETVANRKCQAGPANAVSGFVLMDINGAPFLGLNGGANIGFDRNGVLCTTFNKANPDGRCVIRPITSWYAVDVPNTGCVSPPCKQSVEINVAFDLALRPGETISVNPERFSVDASHENNVVVLENSMCEADDRVPVGVDDGGELICEDADDVAPDPCRLPWGGSIQHEQTVTAYPTPTVGCNQRCQPRSRRCFNGRLSGSGNYRSCRLQPPPISRRLVINVPNPRDPRSGTNRSGWRSYNFGGIACGNWRSMRIRIASYRTVGTTCGGNGRPYPITVPARSFTIYRGRRYTTRRVARHSGCRERQQTDYFEYSGGSTIRVRNESRCLPRRCGSRHGGGATQIYIDGVRY